QQGKGTGRSLVNYIVNEIKKIGGQILELNVNRHNPAVSFYNKMGFVIAREENIDIGNGFFMNDYVMELSVRS
ncbi:MAG: GNAT family N-acetyltransferase, partial [Ferruginibacter sp.]|nr:GNAT family N-acetyltransferase [Ferruginibacter sp.]